MFVLEDSLILIDCGVGSHYRLSDKGYLGDIDAILVTHSHIDHFLGLPEILFQAHIEGRRKELVIYAPKIVAKLINTITPYLYRTLQYKFRIEPIIPMRELSIGNNKVIAYNACHPTADEAYAFKIITRDYTLGYSGDTSELCEQIVKNFKNLDILIHEATCDERHREVCHKYGHTTNREAIGTASLLNVSNLILNHIDEYFNSDIVREVSNLRKAYSFQIMIANDQDVLHF